MASFLGGYFIKSEFEKVTKFSSARFKKEGSFRASTFHDNCDFAFANFAPDDNSLKILTATRPAVAVADFVGVTVVEPAELSLYRVNEHSRQGLLAALTNSTIERFRFEDVHWYRRHGRIVIHDELEESWASTSDYTGLVAITYRRLISNFEAVRAYELAEDCFIGAMEMKRRVKRDFIFARFRSVLALYMRRRWASWIGRVLSITNLYRLLSNYGSSYTRALFVLGLFWTMFSILFLVFGLYSAGSKNPVGQSETWTSCSSEFVSWHCARQSEQRRQEMWRAFTAGALMTGEVATFQRQISWLPVNSAGRVVRVCAAVVIPGQVALLALALRRRFQR